MADVTAPGRQLHSKFIALGNMTGKTAQEIVAAVGRPTSVSNMANGCTLLQWQKPGCHMALLFDSDMRMLKITHEYANYQPAQGGCATVIAIVIGIIVILGAVILGSH